MPTKREPQVKKNSVSKLTPRGYHRMPNGKLMKNSAHKGNKRG